MGTWGLVNSRRGRSTWKLYIYIYIFQKPWGGKVNFLQTLYILNGHVFDSFGVRGVPGGVRPSGIKVCRSDMVRSYPIWSDDAISWNVMIYVPPFSALQKRSSEWGRLVTCPKEVWNWSETALKHLPTHPLRHIPQSDRFGTPLLQQILEEGSPHLYSILSHFPYGE